MPEQLWLRLTRYLYSFSTFFCFELYIQSLSDEELLHLLAEAKLLKERYGISLKDACHRLYMAEVSKLDTIDTAEKGMAAIDSRLSYRAMEVTTKPIELIDSGAFNDHVLPYGKWPRMDEDPAEATAMDWE
jgi:hypothetical protein